MICLRKLWLKFKVGMRILKGQLILCKSCPCAQGKFVSKRLQICLVHLCKFLWNTKKWKDKSIINKSHPFSHHGGALTSLSSVFGHSLGCACRVVFYQSTRPWILVSLLLKLVQLDGARGGKGHEGQSRTTCVV